MKINSLKSKLAPLFIKANIPYAIAAIVLLGLVGYLGSSISTHIETIETWFAGIGYWAILAFVLFFILVTSFLVPESILSIIAGALFGFQLGIVVVVTSIVLSSIVQYWLSKSLFREPINKKLQAKPKFLAIQKAVMKDEFRLQVLLRLTPLNPTIISYLLGAAGVKIKGFIIACFAMVPLLCVEVYIGVLGKNTIGSGDSSGNVDEVASNLQNTILIVGLLVSIVVIYLVSKAARKAIDEASADS